MEIAPVLFAAVAILPHFIIIRRETRDSVGSTTLAEAIVCIVGFLVFVSAKGIIFWTLATATNVGSITAALSAALSARKVNSEKLTPVIGLVSIVPALILVRTFIF